MFAEFVSKYRREYNKFAKTNEYGIQNVIINSKWKLVVVGRNVIVASKCSLRAFNIVLEFRSRNQCCHSDMAYGSYLSILYIDSEESHLRLAIKNCHKHYQHYMMNVDLN